MKSTELKKIIGKILKDNNFVTLNGNWFKESDETIVVLNLQKSNFSDKYYLNIRIFIKGLFCNFSKMDKKWIKNQIGDVFLRAPKEFDYILDMENNIGLEERIEKIQDLFNKFIVPFSSEAFSVAGIKSLYLKSQINLLPAVKEALKIEHPNLEF